MLKGEEEVKPAESVVVEESEQLGLKKERVHHYETKNKPREKHKSGGGIGSGGLGSLFSVNLGK